MVTRKIRLVLCTLVAAFAAVPAAASAATPIQVGEGAGVAVAVDDAGTAHVVSRHGPPSSPHVTNYCRVPKGTTEPGCPAPQQFPPRVSGNGVFDRALVAVHGSTVIALWNECCAPDEVNARISTDGGVTFGPVRTLAAVGGDTPVSPGGDAVTDGGFVAWTSGVASSDHGFQRAPLAGPPATERASLFGIASFGAVSALVGGDYLVVEETDSSALRHWRSTGGDPNLEASWPAPKPIATSGNGFKRPSLAGDGTEAFLAYSDAEGSGPDRPVVRRYNAAGDNWGPPVLVADQAVSEIDAGYDPAAGRLDVVWSNSRGIWWSSSTDLGASFTTPLLLTSESATDLDVGSRAGGGFAGFRTLSGDVFVVPLEEADNEFRFGKTKRNKRKGTAKITVRVPGPGEVELAGNKKLKSQAKRASSAGNVTLQVRPKGKAKRKLKRKARGPRLGKLKVRAAVTYTPDGGRPKTETIRVKLVLR